MAGDVNTFMATMVAPSRPVPIARALALVRDVRLYAAGGTAHG